MSATRLQGPRSGKGLYVFMFMFARRWRPSSESDFRLRFLLHFSTSVDIPMEQKAARASLSVGAHVGATLDVGHHHEPFFETDASSPETVCASFFSLRSDRFCHARNQKIIILPLRIRSNDGFATGQSVSAIPRNIPRLVHFAVIINHSCSRGTWFSIHDVQARVEEKYAGLEALGSYNYSHHSNICINLQQSRRSVRTPLVNVYFICYFRPGSVLVYCCQNCCHHHSCRLSLCGSALGGRDYAMGGCVCHPRRASTRREAPTVRRLIFSLFPPDLDHHRPPALYLRLSSSPPQLIHNQSLVNPRSFLSSPS